MAITTNCRLPNFELSYSTILDQANSSDSLLQWLLYRSIRTRNAFICSCSHAFIATAITVIAMSAIPKLMLQAGSYALAWISLNLRIDRFSCICTYQTICFTWTNAFLAAFVAFLAHSIRKVNIFHSVFAKHCTMSF